MYVSQKDTGLVKSVIMGCGDVGRRLIRLLIEQGHDAQSILAYVRSEQTRLCCSELLVSSALIDLDEPLLDISSAIDGADLYYFIPPQTNGISDLRSRVLQQGLSNLEYWPRKMVLISTTGVYGDCDGEWVDEQSTTQPLTDRGKRRLDSEHGWLEWCTTHQVPLNILRVPGIYANSRIPRQRLENRTPVVRAQECGFSNRIHADDLALVALAAMQSDVQNEIFNATDGTPGKISEYLQAACEVLGLEPLPEITMQEAQQVLSAGMLSYLNESRRISNTKMLEQLQITLSHPDFRDGLRH